MIYIINLCQLGLVIIMDVNACVGKKWGIKGEDNKGQTKKGKNQTVLCWRFLLSIHPSLQKNYLKIT